MHIPFKNDRPITGTIRYISINTHKGFEQSRRDDLESACYIIIYFLNGKLHWDGIKCKTKEEKIQKIMEKKEEFKNIKEYKQLPQPFPHIIQYIYNLSFEEKPNYEYIFGIINKGLEQFEGESNYEKTLYDWQSIEFVIEPIFMIEEIKEKKLLEKMKEESKKREEEKKKEKIEDKSNKEIDNKIINNKNNTNNHKNRNEDIRNHYSDNKIKKTFNKKISKNKKQQYIKYYLTLVPLYII